MTPIRRGLLVLTAVALFGFAATQCSTSPEAEVARKPANSEGAVDLCGDGGTCCDAGSCCDGGTCCDGGDCCEAQSVQIIAPDPDGVVSTSQAALIMANLLPPQTHRGELQVEIYAIRASDGTRFDIAQGDLRLLGGPDSDIAARWVLDGVSPDRYTIYVVVTFSGCPQLSATVDVVVNQAPQIDALVALSCDLQADGFHVAIQAIASDPDGNGIVPDSYEWYPGGDSAPEFGTDIYQHTFPSSLSETEVAVSVFDSLGGSALLAKRLNLLACAFLDDDHANDCGCDDMAIESRYNLNARSGIYCADNAREIPPGCRQINIRNGCPPGKVQFDCLLGPMSPSGSITVNKLGFNFQVEAHIDNRTRNVDRCSSGQIARGTNRYTSRGRPEVVDPPPAAQTTPTPRHPHPDDADFSFEIVNGPRERVPAFDEGSTPPKFGGDNYTREWLFMRRHTNNLWFWFDNPGIRIDPPDLNVKQQSQFVSWVTGNLGSCWCRYEIQHEWDRTNGRTAIGGGAAPNTVRRIAGRNCRVPVPSD